MKFLNLIKKNSRASPPPKNFSLRCACIRKKVCQYSEMDVPIFEKMCPNPYPWKIVITWFIFFWTIIFLWYHFSSKPRRRCDVASCRRRQYWNYSEIFYETKLPRYSTNETFHQMCDQLSNVANLQFIVIFHFENV